MAQPTPRAGTAASWQRVPRCPGCGSLRAEQLGALAGDGYALSDRVIPFPEGGVRLLRCPGCRLAYKSVVATPAAIEAVFAGRGEHAWTTPYSFAPEAEFIRALVGRDEPRMLDVGAADGGLLHACRGFARRRSALDLTAHPRLADTLSGEFIHGTLDRRPLVWSGEPYDVVTVFDVLEHLYDVPSSLANLADLVAPDGFLVIETGDAEAVWPQRYGLARWWYARLFEHHVFWSRAAFERLAIGPTFELVGMRSVRHKVRGEEALPRAAADGLKALAYASWPAGYERLARATGRAYWQPASPFAADHLRVVLRRRP